jgi:hypothetical protein
LSVLKPGSPNIFKRGLAPGEGANENENVRISSSVFAQLEEVSKRQEQKERSSHNTTISNITNFN